MLAVLWCTFIIRGLYAQKKCLEYHVPSWLVSVDLGKTKTQQEKRNQRLTIHMGLLCNAMTKLAHPREQLNNIKQFMEPGNRHSANTSGKK